jgi:hypothetical protein
MKYIKVRSITYGPAFLSRYLYASPWIFTCWLGKSPSYGIAGHPDGGSVVEAARSAGPAKMQGRR